MGPSVAGKRKWKRTTACGLAFAVAAAALSGVPALAAEGAPPARTPTPLGKALRDEIGQGGSVAILGSYDGLIALSADGKRRRTLVPGGSHGVRVDNRSEVIWYGAAKTTTVADLMVLDLRAAEARPVLVMSNLGLGQEPEVAYESPDEVTPSDHRENVLFLQPAGPVLQRVVDACGGKQRKGCPKISRVPCASDGRRCPSIQPAAVPFLKDLAARGAGRSLFLPALAAAKLPKVPLGEFECRRCGRATAIPGTPYWAVLVQAEGDFCHVVSQVYDPKTKQFVDVVRGGGAGSPHPLGDLNAGIANAWIAPGGDALIQAGTLHSFSAGRIPWKGAAEGGGFLGGGWWVPEVDLPCG